MRITLNYPKNKETREPYLKVAAVRVKGRSTRGYPSLAAHVSVAASSLNLKRSGTAQKRSRIEEDDTMRTLFDKSDIIHVPNTQHPHDPYSFSTILPTIILYNNE